MIAEDDPRPATWVADAVAHGVTPRELQVLTLLIAGRTRRETAEALRISPKTLQHHISHVLRRMRAATLEALLARWVV